MDPLSIAGSVATVPLRLGGAKPLSVTASVIVALKLTAEVINYVHDIKDAPEECQQFASDASLLLSLLTNLRDRLEQATSDDPWYAAVNALNAENGPLGHYQQALKQIQSRLEAQDELQYTKTRLRWNFSKDQLADVLAKMERLKNLVNISLEMDHFKLSQAIKDNNIIVEEPAQKAIQSQGATIEGKRSPQWDLQKLQQHQAVMEWLSPNDFSAQLHDILSREVVGTGEWFLNSPEFKAWQQEPGTTLFCPGIPGAGKTMTAAIATDYLHNLSSSEDIGVAYLFCNYKTQTTQTTIALPAAILKQLMQNRLDTLDTVADLYKYHQENKSYSSIDVIFDALQHICSIYSVTYLVVDALNEIKDDNWARANLLDKIRKLQLKTNLRLMLTSRFIPKITDKSNSDRLLEIWVSDYDEALKRIEGQSAGSRKLAKQALSWITYAQRPLTTQELCHALAIQPGDKELDPASVCDIKDILSVCEGLVTVDNKSNVVRFVHHTTQEYLERIRLEWIPNAQHDIATACITYLAMDRFLDGSCSTYEMFEVRLKDNSFLTYAAQYWGKHAEVIQESISDLALKFLCCQPLIDTTVQVATIQAGRSKIKGNNEFAHVSPILSNKTNGLHLVARYGLMWLTKLALEKPEYNLSANSKDQKDRTPLWWAAANGHEAVVRLLVERDDVEVDAKDQFCRTPLWWAAANGHEAVVRLLIERDDVEINARDTDGRTPLSLAAANGHEAVVRLLVERDDVEVDAKDQFCRTPLWWAVANGNDAMVRLLVERDDVEVNARDTDGRTPLSWATENGNEVMVRLLLETGRADAETKDANNKTPRLLAIENGHEAIIKLFSEVETGVDSKDRIGTLLQDKDEQLLQDTPYLHIHDTSDLISVLSVEVPPSLTSGSTLSDTSRVAKTAAQEFAEVLIGDGAMQPLFSVAIERAGLEKFQRNFIRLLTKYAVDLNVEADNPIHIQAARLVRSRANFIVYLVVQSAQCEETAIPSQSAARGLDTMSILEPWLQEQILQTQLPKSSNHEPNISGVDFQPVVPNADEYETEDDEVDEPEKPSLSSLDEVKKFMVESKAFQELRENFVHFASPNKASTGTGAHSTGATENSVMTPYRLHWKCSCGHKHYDDFVEKIPGNITGLVNLLQQDGVQSRLEVLQIDSAFSKLHYSFLPLRNMTVRLIKRVVRLFHHTSLQTFSHQSTPTSTGIPDQASAPDDYQSTEQAIHPVRVPPTIGDQANNAAGRTNIATKQHQQINHSSQDGYMLLCSDERGWLTTWEDLNVSQTRSDRELFVLFRSRLNRRKTWARRYISLKTIQRISFVKFALRQDQEVDQVELDQIPPQDADHYAFHERIPGYLPPIGNRYLMHRFSNPAHCRDSTFCRTQIPKRVRGRPRYGFQPDNSTAWGLYFQESLDMPRLCICGLVAFVLSLAFGLAWGIRKNSLQDGFTVASYIITLEAVIVGTSQVLMNRY